MSKKAPPAPTAPRLVVIAAEFNRPLIDAMIAAAKAEADALGAEIVRELRVPGCYEIPLIAATELRRKKTDAVIVLGYIEKGETLHGEVMGHAVSRALIELQLATGKPIGFGIIGPGATAAQAQARADGHGRAAIRAALASLALLRG